VLRKLLRDSRTPSLDILPFKMPIQAMLHVGLSNFLKVLCVRAIGQMDKASDYESGDCRFDPYIAHNFAQIGMERSTGVLNNEFTTALFNIYRLYVGRKIMCRRNLLKPGRRRFLFR
jgi:hypothetical protein